MPVEARDYKSLDMDQCVCQAPGSYVGSAYICTVSLGSLHSSPVLDVVLRWQHTVVHGLTLQEYYSYKVVPLPALASVDQVSQASSC